MATIATSSTTSSSSGIPITTEMESFSLTDLGAAVTVTLQATINKSVRFNDNLEYLPPDVDETDHEDEHRWFSEAEIASFREDAIRTVQSLNAAGEENSELLDLDHFCLRGLEKKMLKRPPPHHVKNVLSLQAHQKRSGKGDLATTLQLFSIACSKWARKRAIQLAAEDEYDAYHIFMAGLRKSSHDNQNNNHNKDNDDDDYDYDDQEKQEEHDDDYDYDDDDQEFDFCTEGDFVNNMYDYKHKHDPTEDETEYDDSYYDEEYCEPIFHTPIPTTKMTTNV